MVCSFIGHRDAPSSIIPELESTLIDLIENKNVDYFLVGTHGGFDSKTLKIQRQLFVSSSKELTKTEYKQLLNAALSQHNKRLYMLMQTICATGIRVSDDIYCKGRWAEIPID